MPNFIERQVLHIFFVRSKFVTMKRKAYPSPDEIIIQNHFIFRFIDPRDDILAMQNCIKDCQKLI